MRKVILLSLAIVLAAGLAVALEPVGRVLPIEAEDPGLLRDEYDCMLGNNPNFEIGWAGGGIYWYPDFWITNSDFPQEYVYLISRVHLDCGVGCSEGWALNWTGMFKAMDEFTEYDAQIVLYNSTTTSPYAPTTLIYESDVIEIRAGEVPNWSAWILFKDLEGWDQDCVTPPYGRFFVGVRLLTNPAINDDPLDPLNGPVTDRAFTAGGAPISYLNYPGIGWLNAQDAGLSGNFAVWTTIDCCWNNVQTEESSWGQIKGLFR